MIVKKLLIFPLAALLIGSSLHARESAGFVNILPILLGWHNAISIEQENAISDSVTQEISWSQVEEGTLGSKALTIGYGRKFYFDKAFSGSFWGFNSHLIKLESMIYI